MTPMFRYFLGFQVPAARAGWLARQMPPVAGDLFAGLKPQLYHLTLCTIAETAEPHPFLRQRVARAFEAGLPAASPIPFGRIVARGRGAELVAAGRSNLEVAAAVYVSVKTVEAHKAHIMAKLHARNRTDLIRYAIRKGIVRLESVDEAERMIAQFNDDSAAAV